MTNNAGGVNKGIKINGQKLETFTSLKYLASFVSDEGFKPEIPCRIAQTTAALTRLKPVRNGMCIVTSIFLYACELWTLNSRAAKKNTSHGNEVLPQDTTHLT